MQKAILLIIDGLGDLPTPKTPLQAAKTPNLDRLAKNGINGMLSPIKRYIVPGSDTGHLSILGYDPAVFYCGRGPFEALGLGIELQEGDVAFRTNFATVKDDRVEDRRAGRIDTETASKLSKGLSMKIGNVEIIFRNSVEHRGALVLRGPNLSSNVSDTDPHQEGVLQECVPLEDSWEAKRTADIINRYTEVARGWLSSNPANKGRKLPANALMVRGAGAYAEVPSFFERFKMHGLCVAGGALYKGVAAYLKMDVALVPSATGGLKTDVRAKAEAAAKALEGYDFVFMHIKGCDSASHDGNFNAKKKMLEKIDKVIPILEKSGASLVITGDHSTPVSMKSHSGHEVPILVYKGERNDKIKKFDELSCAQGGLGHIKGKDVLPLILNITGRAEKYGS
ncbi:2,3-bisphosphoglycerate-independent phosphoglycerate mutase [Candidatus Micrarchaeota archaeon]|nr:2,3-bisphosphoglycerate-independent phosphoglycerate mutase [Candidatus Micrarchaeota archaeon]